MKKQLIVSADDFGLTRRVNDAIIEAHRTGVVTSASLMVNGAAFEQAADLARNNPGLDIGLHLNLTHKPAQLAAALFRGQVTRTDLEGQVEIQIEKALTAGVTISHIDGHKHVHAIPQVLEIVRRVAPSYGIRTIRSLRSATPALASLLARNPNSRSAILKQYAMSRAAAIAWRFGSGGAGHRFYGITETGFLDLEAFAAIIKHLTPGVHEVMCHPGYVDDDLRKTPTRLLHQRERELELLTSRELRNLIESAGIELVSYRTILDSNGNERSNPLLHRRSAL